MAETEAIRDWQIDKSELKFSHDIMFNGRLEDISVLRVVVRVWKRLNYLNPDVLVLGGYNYAAYWAGFLWAKRNKKKQILWSSSNADDRDRSFLKEGMKGFLVRRCDAANVYGERNRDYLVKLGMKEDRIFLKGNSTNNTFYYHGTMKLKSEKEVLCERFGLPIHNFLYVGRFSKEKNLLRLLEAFKKLETKNSNWGLILVGNGPQNKEIERYIRRVSLKKVYMPGFKQQSELPRYLAVSDVFILPSISEPWGLVVNEAMASGLPVLVSRRCGCYPDLIREGVNGFSFDPFKIDELHRLMSNVVEGEYCLESMGKASLTLIKNYTPEKAARVIKNTIDYVLDRRHP